MNLRTSIFEYVKREYYVEPDYPWMKDPESAVLRHSDTRKWFGIVMPAPKAYLGTGEDGYEDVLTIKCEPMLIDGLIQKDGYYRAYHMNKKQWMSIRLDGTVSEEKMFELLHMSYEMTRTKKDSGKLYISY